jgi:hypothetical protein
LKLRSLKEEQKEETELYVNKNRIVYIKVGKFHPKTGHESPEGE